MADSLSIKSRDFYEYAGIKMTFSIVLAALGMYAMDRLCSAGGQSKYFGLMGDQLSGDAEDAMYASEDGFGFAAFFFFLATIFFWGAAIYISPFVFGSENEKTILKTKQEVSSEREA
mmetsp:Transcript_16150/g.27078  ORF Transcript_16150/g.27078 Transcript_16150/m.27078 type:complete len:117 (-) Transcript_16150:331-681(-)